MKKMMIAAAMALLLFGAVPAQAESHGSALIPALFVQYKNSTSYNFVQILLSNVTEGEVECSIKVFDHEGDLNNGIVTIQTGTYSAGNAPQISSNPVFTIPAGGSRIVRLESNDVRCIAGHAIIEWTSENDKVGKALIGGIRYRGGSGFGLGVAYINNGQPF